MEVGNDPQSAASFEQLFKLITEEIKDLDEAAKLRGWTPWVILASFVSASWIIVQDIWTAVYSQVGITSVFLFVSAGVQLARITRKLLSNITEPYGKAKFFLVHADASAIEILALSLWMGTIAWACYSLRPHATGIVLTAALLFYALVAVLLLWLAVIVACRFPIPMSHSGRRVLTVAFGFTCIALHILMLYTIACSGAAAAVGLIEIRVGSLLALGLFSLTVLTRTPEKAALRDTLAEIRRELVLGETSLDEALHRSRVALQGMWLSDIAREDTRKLLGFISNVRGEYEDAFRRIHALRAVDSLDQSSAPAAGSMVALALGNTLDVLKGHEWRVIETARQYHRLLSEVRARLKLVTKLFGVASDDLERLLTEIRRAQVPVDELQERFIADYRDLQNVWNVWFPSERRSHTPFGLPDTQPNNVIQPTPVKWGGSS